jgi:phosphoglycolate phosphatase
MRLIVFDMDGTLLDTAAIITARVEGAFRAAGLEPPPAKTIRAHVGMTLAPYLALIAGTEDADLVARLVAAYRAIVAAEPPNAMPLFVGAREALERLADKPHTFLGIATGKGRAGVDRALEENAVARHFATMQTPDTNPGKPHPGMLLSAMAACGVSTTQTVMVGDATLDIEMAGAAGVPAIGVSWGMHAPAELRAAGAAAIAESFEGLDGLIDEVLEAQDA